MERLAAQLAEIKNQLLVCQDPEEREADGTISSTRT